MNRHGWTIEDQNVLLHAIARSDTSFMLLVSMVTDDEADMHIMYNRVEGRACDAWALRESTQEDLDNEERWAAAEAIEDAQYDSDLS